MNIPALQQRLALLLRPAGAVYGAVMRLRAARYADGKTAAYRASRPVVSVGNISWGGTGKTPVTDYLLDTAAARGLCAAVLTRGYKADLPFTPYPVWPDDDPARAGDEPLMLARRHPEALIVADPVRARAAAWAEIHKNPDIFFLDDGMQHLAMHRDLDIVLLTPNDLANGWNKVIPAGTWREDASALARAGAFCVKVDESAFFDAGADAMPGATHDAKGTPGAMHDEMPGVTPGAMHDARPDMTPDAMHDATPDMTHDARPDATPGATPDMTHDATPGATPDMTHDATPGAMPNVTPNMMLSATHGGMPDPALNAKGAAARRLNADLEETVRARLGGFGRPVFFFTLRPSGLIRLTAHAASVPHAAPVPHVASVPHAAPVPAPVPVPVPAPHAPASAALPEPPRGPYTLACGTGDPDQVRATVSAFMGREPSRALTVPDHHAYTPSDAATLAGWGHPVICTAKDAVKLAPLLPAFGETPVWVLEVRAAFGPALFTDQAFDAWWADRLTALVPGRS